MAMKNPLRHWIAAGAGVAATLAFSSCTYDPYYVYPGGAYRADAGVGYGYGGGNFSTSLFVATGDPRWGYDPYSYSYYDYRRRCYYDPYLNGYYPIGYRPTVVYGVPHPYGWSPGHGYCPPPRNVNYAVVVNYRNRETAYRNSSYSWARQVSPQSPNSGYVTRSTYSQTYAAPRQASTTNYARNYGPSYPSAAPSGSVRSYGGARQPTGNDGEHGAYSQGSSPSYRVSPPRPPASGFSRPAAMGTPQPRQVQPVDPPQASPSSGRSGSSSHGDGPRTHGERGEHHRADGSGQQ